jgi:hypothetical protein
MQGRLTTDRCYFLCDAEDCAAQFVSGTVVFKFAVEEMHRAGWHSRTMGPGHYLHRCPAHRHSEVPHGRP